MTVLRKKLALLPRTRWDELHRLMVAQNFPAVPASFNEAQPYFAQARIYALTQAHELLCAFVFGAPQEGVSFLDVVCAPHQHGLWATPAVLRRLYKLAFAELGLRVVWVQPRRKAGLRAALQAGFVPGTPLGVGHPVLVMTPFGVPQKFRHDPAIKTTAKTEGENDHGQFI